MAKIRTGFVSNSSSSSFILIGTKATPDYDKMAEKFNISEDELNDYGAETCVREEMDDNEFSLETIEESRVVGKIIGYGLEDGNSGEISIQDIINTGKEIAEFFELNPDTEMKIYYGVKYD